MKVLCGVWILVPFTTQWAASSVGTACCLFLHCDWIKSGLASIPVWLSESLGHGPHTLLRVFSDRLHDGSVLAGAFGSHPSTWVLSWSTFLWPTVNIVKFLNRNCVAVNKNPQKMSCVWRDQWTNWSFSPVYCAEIWALKVQRLIHYFTLGWF